MKKLFVITFSVLAGVFLIGNGIAHALTPPLPVYQGGTGAGSFLPLTSIISGLTSILPLQSASTTLYTNLGAELIATSSIGAVAPNLYLGGAVPNAASPFQNFSGTLGTGNFNVFPGAGAGLGIGAHDNVNIGNSAGNGETTGVTDTVNIGHNAGLTNTDNNTINIGQNAGEFETAGGGGDVNIGWNSCKNNIDGGGTVCIGENTGPTNTRGDQVTLIGNGADVSSSLFGGLFPQNATAIGYTAKVGCSNCFSAGSDIGTGFEVKLGVGTSSPFARLSVGTGAGDTGLYVGSSTAEFVVAPNENIGIGTPTPNDKLDIVGSGAQAHIEYSQSDSATAPTALANGYYVLLGGQEFAPNAYRLIGFGYNLNGTSVPAAYIGYQEINETAYENGDLVFGTRNTTTQVQPSERMRITAAGNVGIATTSPSKILSVSGDSYFAGKVGVNTNSPGADLEVDGNMILKSVTGNPFTLVTASGANSIHMTGSGSGKGWISTDSGPIALVPALVGTPVLTATAASNGRVGINNFNPGAALDVNGSINVVAGQSYNYNNLGIIFMNGSLIELGDIGNNNLPLGLFAGNNQRVSITTGGLVGIGTTSPFSTLSVTSGSSSVSPFTISTSTGATLFQIDAKGNQLSSGDQPTVSCTPSGGTIAGDNTQGDITTGTLSTACTVTFQDGGYPAGGTMSCQVSDNSTSISFDVSALSNTAVTFTSGTALTGHLYYHCGEHINK